MEISSLGHAGLEIRGPRARVLVDPWLSPYGAHQASWFQYPDNDHLVERSLIPPDAVLISHEHLDHLDPWLVARLPTSVPIVIPRYPSVVVRRKLEAARPGGVVVEVTPWRWLEVAAGVEAMFVSEESPMNHDSAIVVRANGHVLVDLNDARLAPAQLRSIRAEVGRVDLLALQGAGASWHPMVYDLPEAQKRRISRQKRAAKLAYVTRAVRAVDPDVVLPFAGPPCFLDPELFRHNREMEDGVFPDQFAVAEWLAQQGTQTTVLLPGDTWDATSGEKASDPRWAGFSNEDRWPYLEEYSARKLPLIEEELARWPSPSESLWLEFRDWFGHLLTLSPYFNRRIGMRVGFEIVGPGGGCWAVDFRPGTEGVHDEAGPCGHTYRFASRWLRPLLSSCVGWEDFLLSLRFEATRVPDIHNEHLLGILKLAQAPALDAVEAYETASVDEERIVVCAEGRSWSVPRRCPHAGADLLETSEILPGGVLRCLGHYYEFDLRTGACINGSCAPLASVPVDDAVSGMIAGFSPALAPPRHRNAIRRPSG